MTDRNKMMIIFVKLRLCNEKCSSSTKTTILFIQPIHSTQSSPKEALKNFNKSLLLLCLSSAIHDERGHPHQWFFFQKRHLREVNCAQDQLHFFFICFLFFLNPQNPNDHHLHQHSQTPNNLPIVWCLTNNLLTSWSLILLNLNSSKKITSINVLPHHLTINQHLQSSTFFFYLTNQFDNKIPHLIHQTPINLQIQI